MLTLNEQNINYGAMLITLPETYPLEKCDNIKGVKILGNQVLVRKESLPGELGIYFPVESQICDEFLFKNNLYSDPLRNKDVNKRGYFLNSGRVRAQTFRGHKSEGFYLPESCLEAFENFKLLKDPLRYTDVEFDSINGIQLCQKYFVAPVRSVGAENVQKLTKNIEERIVPGQFQFHSKTTHFAKIADSLSDDTEIVITEKMHGTSAIIANLLIQKELSFFERLAVKLGLPIVSQKYAIIWASRRIIKGIDTSLNKPGYYKTDIWGEVKDEIKDKIPKGYTIYGEITGYASAFRAIQKAYVYNALRGQHDFHVYRVTHTNVDGFVTELSFAQMQSFCAAQDLATVPLYYKGPIKNYSSQSSNRNFFEKLKDDLEMYADNQVKHGKMPMEGFVVRADLNGVCCMFKIKSSAFLQHKTKMLDSGEDDMETAQE